VVFMKELGGLSLNRKGADKPVLFSLSYHVTKRCVT
jgi:hypothetical protein